MHAPSCAQRKAAIAALSEFFLRASRSFYRNGSSRAESLCCQVETHAERLSLVADLAAQGRGSIDDVASILADLQELGVFADNRLMRDVYRVFRDEPDLRAA